MKKMFHVLKKYAFHSLTALLLVSILMMALPADLAQAVTQYLGGRSIIDDLRIQVLDDGRIGVERYTTNAWERQIYNITSKGSRLQFDGGSLGLGYFSGGSVSMVSNTSTSSQVNNVRTWTSTTKWNGSGFDVQQTITYREGDPYFKLQWNITNVSGGQRTGLRFFHGEDTYLRNGDNGAGWVDWNNYTIGVRKNVGGTEQRMSLQAISPAPFAYQSDNYYSMRQAVNGGALTRNVDSNESTDNGYALEWREGALANSSTWTIQAYEKFNNVNVGAVQVMAPVATDCLKGDTCSLRFTVKNPGASSVTVGLSYTTAINNWPVTASHTNGASVSIPGGGSIPVTFSVTVPGNAANGSQMELTLNAAPTTGAATSETAAVNALTPPNTAPANLRLNGSTALTVNENNDIRQALGTLSATDAEGDAISFSMVGGDTGFFTLSGNQLLGNAPFNYEARTAYSLTVRASDGKGGVTDQAFSITVGNVNETPVLAAMSGTQVVDEDHALTFTMTATDPDGASAANALVWSVPQDQGPANGALSGVSGSGSSKTITYTPNLNFNGTDRFTIRVTDAGGLTSAQIINVTVNAVNDAPVNAWNAGSTYPAQALKVRVGQTITFDAGAARHTPSLISVNDVEATTLQLTLTVSKGSLVLNDAVGLSGDTNGADGTLAITGTKDALNAALKGLSYTPNAGYSGPDRLTITTSDLGVTGQGGVRTDSDAVDFAIANPDSFIIDDNFTGATADWHYNRFASIEEAMAAAQAVDDTNNPKAPLTLTVNAGSYLSDSILLTNPRVTLRLDGDVRVGKDVSVSAGVLDADGHTLSFATGQPNVTSHTLSGAVPLHNLAVESGNTLNLANGAELSLAGALTLPEGAAFHAAPQDGRATVRLTGSGEQSLPSGLTLDNLIINPGVTFNAPAALTLQGDLAAIGSFNGGSGTLTFAGPEGRTQAIRGSVPQLGSVNIAEGSRVALAVGLNVSGNWSDSGQFAPGSHSVTFNGASQTFAGQTIFNNATVAGSSTLTLAPNADFGYAGVLTLAGEIDPLANPNTTVRLAGASAQDLPDGLTEVHHLVINPGSSLTSSKALILHGDLTNGGALDNRGGSLTFSGPTHAIHVGDGAVTQFGGFTNPAGSTVTPDENIELKVAGNWNNAGVFVPNGGLVTFNGDPQTFSGETIFHNVNVPGNLSLAPSADFGYAGSFARTGAFQADADGAMLRIAGAAPQSLPSGLTSLYHMAVNPGASLDVANLSLSLKGGINNAGSLDNTGGQVTFTGGGSHPLTIQPGAARSQLGDLVIDAGNTLETSCTAATPLMVSGDWTKSGDYTANQCLVIFNGDGPQQILGAGNSFYDLSIHNTSAYPNDDSDVSSSEPVAVTHTLSVIQGQFQPAGNSTFANVVLGGDQPEEAGILRPNRGEALLVSGDWTRKSSGWFDANAGRIRFTGADSVISGGANFYDLTVAKAAGKALTSAAPVTADRNLVVETGMFSPSTNSKFKNISILAGGELKPAGNINIGGDLDNQGAYTHNNKAVTFDGSGLQSLAGAVDFYNLTVNTGSTLQLRQNAILGYAGAFVLKGSLDTASFPQNTVEVKGVNLLQGLPAVQVNNLIVRGGSSLRLDGPLTVTGQMNMLPGGFFNANSMSVTFQKIAGSPEPSFSGAATFSDAAVAENTAFQVLEGANFTFTGSVTAGAGGTFTAASSGSGSTVTAAGASGQLPNGAQVNHLVITGKLLGGDRALTVTGNWTGSGSGRFTPETGAVIFTGPAAQSITGAGLAFHNLSVAKSADIPLTSAVVAVGGTLDLSEGIFQPACGSTFHTVLLSGGRLALASDPGCQLNVTGDWSQTDAGQFTPNGGALNFQGASPQTISGPLSLAGLRVASGSSLNLAAGADVALTGPLSLTGSLAGDPASTLTAAGDLTFDSDVTLGNLVIGSGKTITAPHALTLQGSLTNLGTFDNTGGSTIFSGAGDHDITGDGMTRFGDLTTTSGATLRLGGADGNASTSILVSGNWDNQGAFTPNLGTVTFNGGGNQTIASAASPAAFTNLVIDSAGVVSTSVGLPLLITNDLIIRRGILDVQAGSQLADVQVLPGATLQLPVPATDVTANGNWDNQGRITSGAPTQGASFYLASAVVDASLADDTPGLGFDKFKTIAAALPAAEETIYLLGGQDAPLDYAEALAVDGTHAAFIVQGRVQVASIDLSGKSITLAPGAELSTGGAYTQTGGDFFLGGGALILAGDFAPTAGVFHGGSGVLRLGGNFNPADGVFHPDTSTVELNGSDTQAVASGASFHHLVIRNTADPADDAHAVIPNGAIAVAGSLAVEDGQFMPRDASTFHAMHIGANGILKLYPREGAPEPVTIQVLNSGPLTIEENGQLYLNGGVIDGLPQSDVSVKASWGPGDPRMGYDHFNNIPDALAAVVASGLPTGVVHVLDGSYPAQALDHPNVTLSIEGAVTFTGDLSITRGSLNLGSAAVLTLQSSLTKGETATFSAGTGEVILNGAPTQAINGAGWTFNKLTIQQAGLAASTESAVNVASLDVAAGTFTPACGSTFANVRVAAGATLALPIDAGCQISVAGTWDNAGAFSHNNGKVVFNGADAQISAHTGAFYAIEIAPNSKLTAPAGALDVAGDWTNNGVFDPNSGTVHFSGAAQQLSGSGALDFNSLEIAGTSTLTPAPAGRTLTLTGDWNQAGGFTTNGAVLRFTGGAAQLMTAPDAAVFETIEVAKTAGKLTVASPLNLTHHLEIGGGELELTRESIVHNVEGGATAHLAAGATLTLAALPEGEYLSVDRWSSDGGVVNPIAKLIPERISAMEVDDDFGPGTPGFGIDRFNTINDALSKTYLSDGAVITVQAGSYDEAVAVTRPVTLTLADTAALRSITVDHTGAVVHAPSGKVLTLTGSLTVTQGAFAHHSGTLAFSGADEHTLSDGLTLHHLTLAGGALNFPAALTLQGSFANQGGVVDGLGTALTFDGGGSASHTLTGSAAFDTVAVASGERLTLAPSADLGVTRALDLANGQAVFSAASNSTLTIYGAVTLPDGLTLGSLTIAEDGVLTAPAALTLTGSFANQGEFIHGSGTVTLAGSGAHALTASTGNHITFHHLTMDDGDGETAAAVTSASAVVNVTGDLNITDGSFRPSACGQYANVVIGEHGEFAPQTGASCTLQVSGNWTNNGAFTAGGSTIAFNGATAQTIGGQNDTTFGGLEIDNAAGVSVTAPRTVTVAGDLVLTNGAFNPTAGSTFQNVVIEDGAGSLFNAPAGTVSVLGNWENRRGADGFAANNGTIQFSGDSDHTVTGTTRFYNLASQGSGFIHFGSGADVTVTGGIASGSLVSGAADSTLQLMGSGPATLPDGASLGSLVIGPAVTFTAPDTLTLGGSLAVQGSLTAGANLNVGGGFTVAPSGVFNPGAGEVTFTGSGPHVVTGAVRFNDLTADGGTIELAPGAALTLGGDLQARNGGAFDGSAAGSTFQVTGSGAHSLPDGVVLNHLIVDAGATLNVPGSLTIHGDLTVNGTLDNTGGAITFAGAAPAAHAIHGAGPLTFGDLIINEGSTVTPDAGKQIRVGGDWINDGSFTPNGGEVIFDGAGDQAIRGLNSPVAFDRLTIDKDSGALTTEIPVAVSGLLDVAGGTFRPASDSTFTDIYLQNGGLLDAPSGAINVAGDWTDENPGGGLNGGGGLVIFNGAQEQTFSGSSEFSNITIGGASTLVLDSGANLSYSGDFNTRPDGLDATRNTPTTLTLAGVDPQSLPDGLRLNHLTVAPGATLDGTGTGVTLLGGLTANGDITNGLSTTFAGQGAQPVSGGGLLQLGSVIIGENSQVVPAGGQNIQVGGSWTNNSVNNGGFAPGSSTVTFTGDGAHTLGGDTRTTFNNLTVSGGTLTGPAEVTGAATIASGAIFGPASGSTFNDLANHGVLMPESNGMITIAGDWSNTGTFNPNNGTVTLNGAGDQTVTSTSAPFALNNLVISGPGAVNWNVTTTPEQPVPLVVAGDFRMEENAGTFTVPDGAQFHNVQVNEGSTFALETGATFALSGTWNNQGTYDPNGGGLSDESDPLLDAVVVDPACAGTGSGCGIDRFATIQEAIQAVSIDGMVNVLPSSDPHFVYGTAGADTIRIERDKPVRLVFQGNASSVFILAGSIVQESGSIYAPEGTLRLGGSYDRTGGTFEANNGRVVLAGASQTISGLPVTFHRLTIDDGFAATPNTVTANALVTVTHLLTVRNGVFRPAACGDYAAVEIGADGELAPQSETACINVSGGWANHGLFTANGSTVTFNGAAPQVIGGTRSTEFGGLTVQNTASGGVSVDETIDIAVDGHLNVSAGLFAPSGGSTFQQVTIANGASVKPEAGGILSIAGDFINQGSFDPNGGTVVLDGGEDQSLEGALHFYNLDVVKDDATDVVTANSPLAMANVLTVTRGILRFPNASDFNSVAIGADGTFAPANGSTFSISGGLANSGQADLIHSTIVFDGADQQLVTGIANLGGVVINNTAAPQPACATAAECNTYFDAHSVEFDRPVVVEGLLNIQDGQMRARSGSIFTNVTVGQNGRFRGWKDASGDPTSGTLQVTGRLSNRGLFDFNGFIPTGDLSLTEVYVSSDYLPDQTPGFGVDHFNNIQDAIARPGVDDGATVTVYAGAYSGSVEIKDKAYNIVLPGHPADSLTPAPVILSGSLTLDHPEASLSLVSGELRISGDLAIKQGAFEPGTSKVVFNGADGQSIEMGQGSLTFYDLTIENHAVVPGDDADVDAKAPITVRRNLEVAVGQFSPEACSVFANVTIANGAILKPHAPNETCSSGLQVSGNWTNQGGVFSHNGSPVTFNGSTPQTITDETGFGDVVIDNASGVTAAGGFTSQGSLTLQGGTLTLPDGANVNDVTIRGEGRLALQAEPVSTLTVTGNWTDETTGGGLAANNGTVRFAGGEQVFTGATTFHTITIADGSSLTLAENANLGFSGNLTVEPGGAFDPTAAGTTLTVAHVPGSIEPRQLPGAALTLNNLVIDQGAELSGHGQIITILGDFTNDGAFNGGSGSVIFDGPETSTHTLSGSGATNFNNLIVRSPVEGDDPASVGGTLTLDDGGRYHPASGSTLHNVVISDGGVLDGSDSAIQVTGDWTQTGTGAFTSGGAQHPGSVTFSGSGGQRITGSPTFYHMSVTQTDPDNSIIVNDPLTVEGNLAITAGRLVQVQSGSIFNTIEVGEDGQLVAEDDAENITVNQFTFANQNSFVAPGGKFKPSNVLWAADNGTVRSVAEKPAGLTVGAIKTVDLNQDPQTAFQYTLVNTANCGPDNTFFTLGQDDLGQAVIVTNEPLDFETRQAYQVCVQTTDPDGLSMFVTLRVTPTDANDEPVITEDAADGAADGQMTVTIDEDTPLSLTLHATDQDTRPEWSDLNWTLVQDPSHGTLDWSQSPDGAMTLQYGTNTANWNGTDSMQVRVSDGLVDTNLQLNIVVNAVNDAPVNVLAPEILPADQARIGMKVQATSGRWNDNNDPERPGSISVTYQWQRANNDQGAGLVNIEGALESAYIPTAADQGRYIRVMVTAHDSGTGLPASASTAHPSQWIFVPGVAPVGLTLSSYSVAEKLPVGTLAATLNAADSDAGDTFTYELVAGEGSQDNASFAIHGNKLVTNAVFDYAEKAELSIRVRVTDGGGNSYETPVTLQVVGSRAELTPKQETKINNPTTALTPGESTITVPVGAVLDPTTLIFLPQADIPAEPQGMVFANYAFKLAAYQNSEEVKDFEFNKPVDFTLKYPDSMIRNMNESSLRLMVWNGAGWEDAACGAVQADPATNTLKVPVCKLGQFAVFGQAGQVIYLPFISK
jgi:hypothetical protein